MKVYITKMMHGKYNYLANWQNPDNGAMLFDWFETLAELKDYTKSWPAVYVNVNF